MINPSILAQVFEQRFGSGYKVFFAPGRINLIGEHTDYNGGYVFPGAIEQGITAVIRPNGTHTVNLYAKDLGIGCTFDIGDKELQGDSSFRYVFGVIRELDKRNVQLDGFDAVYGGDVPLGAGMSSSAALECCFAYALCNIFPGMMLNPIELARVGQAAEHNYVGVKCGIMDQFASIFGRAGFLVRYDCCEDKYEYFPWNPDGYRLVLVNSCVKHTLVGSPYNDRRASCERVAKAAKVSSLRECTWEKLEAIRHKLADEDYRRARYVLGETDRVLAVSAALERGDYEAVGRQMYLTHEGLRDDYEVSCEELDFLVGEAKRLGVTGSRLMGGGFGGCTINLVRDELYNHFIDEVQTTYSKRFNRSCQPIPVVISDGARSIDIQ